MIIPNPETQKEEIGLLLAEASNMSKGELYYVVSTKWIRLWEDYTSSTYFTSSVTDLRRSGSAVVPGDHAIAHPGEIDNEHLVVYYSNNTSINVKEKGKGKDKDGSGVIDDREREMLLKGDLQEFHDYMLLPPRVGQTLFGWYGGGPVIKRMVIIDNGVAVVEVHPLVLFIQPMKGKKFDISKTMKMIQISRTFAARDFLRHNIIDLQLTVTGKNGNPTTNGKSTSTKNTNNKSTNNKNTNTKNSGKNTTNNSNTQASANTTPKKESYYAELVESTIPLYRLWVAPPRSIDAPSPSLSPKKSKRNNDVSDGTNDVSFALPDLDNKQCIHAASEWHLSLQDLGIVPYSYIYLEKRKKNGHWGIALPSAGKIKESNGKDGNGKNGKNKDKLGRKSRNGICGLSNIALQCLSNTPRLTQYFLSKLYLNHINKKNPLGTKGQLATEYGALIKCLWQGSYSHINPRTLKIIIAKHQPRFAGIRQHDAHELLSCVLDGLHEDLNLIEKKPYVENVEGTGRDDAVVAAEAWKGYLLRNVIPTTKTRTLEVIFWPYDGRRPSRYAMTLQPHATVRDIRVKMRLLTHMDENDDDDEKNDNDNDNDNDNNGSGDDIKNSKGNKGGKGSRKKEYELLVADTDYGSKIYSWLNDDDPIRSIATTDVIVVYEIPKRKIGDLLLRVHVRRRRRTGYQNSSMSYYSHYYNYAGSTQTNDDEEDGYNMSSYKFVGYPMVLVIRPKETSNGELHQMAQEKVNRFLPVKKIRESHGDDNNMDNSSSSSITGKKERNDNGAKNGKNSYNCNDEFDSKRSSNDDNVDGNSDNDDEKEEVNDTNVVDEKVKDMNGTKGRERENNEKKNENEDENENENENEISREKKHALTPTLTGKPSPPAKESVCEGYHFTLSITNNSAQLCRHRDCYDTYCGGCVIPCDKTLVRLKRSDEDAVLALTVKKRHVRQYYNPEESALVRNHRTLRQYLREKDDAKKKKKNISLLSCFKGYTQAEVLGQNDLWYCPSCKDHQAGEKRMEIWTLPPYLVVHLKRFSNSRARREKLNDAIDIPMHDLCLDDYVINEKEKGKMFDLYAVANHSGSLHGGHYTAACYNTAEGQWYSYNDSQVLPYAAEMQTRITYPWKRDAYVLFYKLRDGDGRHVAKEVTEVRDGNDQENEN